MVTRAGRSSAVSDGENSSDEELLDRFDLVVMLVALTAVIVPSPDMVTSTARSRESPWPSAVPGLIAMPATRAAMAAAARPARVRRDEWIRRLPR